MLLARFWGSVLAKKDPVAASILCSLINFTFNKKVVSKTTQRKSYMHWVAVVIPVIFLLGMAVCTKNMCAMLWLYQSRRYIP